MMKRRAFIALLGGAAAAGPDWTPRESRYWPVSEPIIKNSRCPDQKLFMARSSCVFARFKPLLLKAILSSAPVSLF